MCGIGGVLRVYPPGETPPPHHGSIPESWLDALDESIRHRGPDGAGRFRDRAVREDGTTVDVALVHRRLSIIDHEGGAQPMVHVRRPDGTGELLKSSSFSGPPDAPPVAHAQGSFVRGSGAIGDTHEGALSESDGPTTDGATTIDATALPQGTDLVATVFNGCIYNHRELRSELEQLGHRFETDHADTEVLVHGWRAWAHDLPRRLVSMHAHAIWNRSLGEFCIYRGAFGERPLYYTVQPPGEHGRILAFGSCVPGLHRVLQSATGERPPINRRQIAEWISLGFAEPATPFHEIHTLRAGSGHGNVAERTKRRSSVHDLFDEWTAGDEPEELSLPKHPMRSFALTTANSVKKRTLDAVDEILAAAVVQRLEADTPVACLLSGGIDSALVTKYAHDAIGGLPAITVRMPDPRLDESEAAAETARQLGVRHIVVSPDTDAARDLVDLIETLGLPFGDSSLLPTFWAARAAAEHATVLLTGDGGDELFTGYSRHMAARYGSTLGVLSAVPAWLMPLGSLPGREPSGYGERARRLGLAVRRLSYESLLSIFPAPEAARLLKRRAHKPAWLNMPASPYEAACFDREFTLPGDYLRKVDTAAMRVPVETRAPFLDPRVTAVSDRIGEHLSTGGPKAILRALARRHLTPAIADRPKQGFAIPIGEWFRSDFGSLRQLLYDHLESTDPFPGLADAGVPISMGYVHQMLREHDRAGEASRNPWHGRDHSQRLYMLLVLSIWAKWLDRARLDRART